MIHSAKELSVAMDWPLLRNSLKVLEATHMFFFPPVLMSGNEAEPQWMHRIVRDGEQTKPLEHGKTLDVEGPFLTVV